MKAMQSLVGALLALPLAGARLYATHFLLSAGPQLVTATSAADPPSVVASLS